MVHRKFWVRRIEEAWGRRSVVWLSGVRRVGKTVLARGLADVEYFDCELPRVRRMLEDPEAFLAGLRGRRIVLDEIHRLPNPSETLKIAADHFPRVGVLATGSSTLGASSRFRDTLAGRKRDVWLTPMVLQDLDDFGAPDLTRRLLHGGLPPYFLRETPPHDEFQEWVDAYWAKDIQELFRLERRQGFQRLLELVLIQSGGIFEAARFAPRCEVSRPTIANYLSVLDATYVVHVVRPFHARRAVEIVKAPKVYGFDTGFVCAQRGWTSLRAEDLGPLWEHVVLNEIHAHFGRGRIAYWRDKRGHEVDFVVPGRAGRTAVVECKWSASGFDPSGAAAFRRRHPGGKNFVVSRDVERPFEKTFGDLAVRFVGLPDLVVALEDLSPAGRLGG